MKNLFNHYCERKATVSNYKVKKGFYCFTFDVHYNTYGLGFNINPPYCPLLRNKMTNTG